ncbi:UDP-N-acetylglucosamine--dolichyl-phosphate N-acetylglucosaminephosphotransferase [Ceratobasidium theobromae]|uniref:UDP-N-acetylglucosamine--dolichyl-phosphate N-acetylglucosaminephosphotransferase n=1 Tax=Ceratobasidium theobromae TaxID=1582974 RepID=A0A5N5QMY2_9AGAM|nr:UDP-N-acetylglucosamine--dolichyl-phosphate N-acetylglucosaminephosphotransferase [Ceratobasidium theobromae]
MPPMNLIKYGIAPISLYLVLRPLLPTTNGPLPALNASLGFAGLAMSATTILIPPLGEAFRKAGFQGKDMLKKAEQPIPECAGLICASVYCLLLILFIPYPFSDVFAKCKHASLEGLACGSFPHNELAVYLAAILSLLMATLLGFLDDVFDIRWRHKLPIPLVAAIPLLLVYYAENGQTDVVVPIPLRRWLGTNLDLGPLYYLYMALLSTFTTNSINILAGMNGIEVGQALIIAISVALNDLLYLPWSFRFNIGSLELGGVYGAGLAHGSKLLVGRHLLSLYFMLPLIGVCSGLLWHNWYPARVFPGDTFCYFTGMAFAVVGINGHFSKTLLLFFVPQIFNFVLSCPQLFGLVPCPRHRLPKIHPENPKLLIPSTTDFDEKPASKIAELTLELLALVGLTRITYGPPVRKQANGTSSSKSKSDPRKAGKRIMNSTNLTLPNVLLCTFGPMSEPTLVKTVMGIQILGTVLAFCVRYGLAGLVYDGDRR